MKRIGQSTPDEVLATLRHAFAEVIGLKVHSDYEVPGVQDSPVGDRITRVLDELQQTIDFIEELYPFDDDGRPRERLL